MHNLAFYMGGKSIYRKLDWKLIACYLFLVIFGWLNIFAALRGENAQILDFSQKYGMHIIWMGVAFITAISIIFLIPTKTWSVLAWLGYMLIILLLISVLFLGVEVNGSRSWINLGAGIRLQPAEFSKITTSLALAALMGKYGFNITRSGDFIKAAATIALPMLLILMEKEAGLMLVYVSFFIVFYREGMSGWIILLGMFAIVLFITTLVFSPYVSIAIAVTTLSAFALSAKCRSMAEAIAISAGICLALCFFPKLLAIEAIAAINPFSPEVIVAVLTAATVLFFLIRDLIVKNLTPRMRNPLLCMLCCIMFIFSVGVIFENVLKDHQRARIEELFGIREDPMGVGYNVHQSKIAIGSGGATGKGFLQGTQTRFNFVPEQDTDFIFCTVGEEWGFAGSVAILLVYLFMIVHILECAEKNADSFVRIYGYCVALCIAFHVVINVSMTIGLMPVIGIPLPFLSYGGSSLLTFTALLFIFIRLDLDRQIR